MTLVHAAATDLPAIPGPSFLLSRGAVTAVLFALLLGVLVVANPPKGASMTRSARTARAAGTVALLAAVFALLVTYGLWIDSRTDAHKAELREAIESNWDVTYVEGPIRNGDSGWIGEIDGKRVRCLTENTDRLSVKCGPLDTPPARGTTPPAAE